MIFKRHFLYVIIGLSTSGRTAWQEEEETRKDINVVLIHQEQSCTSELFKVIQGRSLIDPTLQDNVIISRTFSSSTLIMSDVQSIYIPSSIQD